MTALHHHDADLGEVRLHYVAAGAGDPVVLLHGWPQTWYCCHRPDALTTDEIDEYLRTYRDPAALHAGFEFYRALPRDAADPAAVVAQGPLAMPVLAIGGASGWGRGHEVAASLRQVAADVHEIVIDDAGHWIPEEQPTRLAEHLAAHFARVTTHDSST